jgi:hypothetical protein
MIAGYKEIRGKVGFFGTIFRVLFWGWQALMIFWIVSYYTDVSPRLHAATTQAHHTGTLIGATMAIGTIFFFWLAGSVILGLFVLFTRAPKLLLPLDDLEP